MVQIKTQSLKYRLWIKKYRYLHFSSDFAPHPWDFLPNAIYPRKILINFNFTDCLKQLLVFIINFLIDRIKIITAYFLHSSAILNDKFCQRTSIGILSLRFMIIFLQLCTVALKRESLDDAKKKPKLKAMLPFYQYCGPL